MSGPREPRSRRGARAPRRTPRPLSLADAGAPCARSLARSPSLGFLASSARYRRDRLIRRAEPPQRNAFERPIADSARERAQVLRRLMHLRSILITRYRVAAVTQRSHDVVAAGYDAIAEPYSAWESRSSATARALCPEAALP